MTLKESEINLIFAAYCTKSSHTIGDAELQPKVLPDKFLDAERNQPPNNLQSFLNFVNIPTKNFSLTLTPPLLQRNLQILPLQKQKLRILLMPIVRAEGLFPCSDQIKGVLEILEFELDAAAVKEGVDGLGGGVAEWWPGSW